MLAYLSGEYTVESNRECGMGRPDIVLIQRGPGRPAHVLLFEFKRGACRRNHAAKAAGTGGLFPGGAKIPGGAKEKWNPEKIVIYGVGFRGKDLALEQTKRCVSSKKSNKLKA